MATQAGRPDLGPKPRLTAQNSFAGVRMPPPGPGAAAAAQRFSFTGIPPDKFGPKADQATVEEQSSRLSATRLSAILQERASSAAGVWRVPTVGPGKGTDSTESGRSADTDSIRSSNSAPADDCGMRCKGGGPAVMGTSTCRSHGLAFRTSSLVLATLQTAHNVLRSGHKHLHTGGQRRGRRLPTLASCGFKPSRAGRRAAPATAPKVPTGMPVPVAQLECR